MSIISKVVILGYTGFIGGTLFRHFQLNKDYPVEGHNSSTLDLTRPESTRRLWEILDESTLLIVAARARHKRRPAFMT